ncbi:MAG: hypothetical protein HY706_19935 [Candidatus Hydrogenedentes bacterium]|nr:hypothetical protein [Candidatus Hydrogenedentota bacterium]
MNIEPRLQKPLIVAAIVIALVLLYVFLPKGGPDTPPAEPVAKEPVAAPVAEGTPAESKPAAAPTESAAAGAGPWLNVVGTVPLPGELLKNQIILFFDEEVVPPKGPDGAVLNPFKVTPIPVHNFKYRVESNFIACTLTQDVADRLYQIEVIPDLQSKSGKRINPDQRKYTFANFVLAPKRLWTLEETPEKTVLGIYYVTAINLDSLRQHLTVRTNDGANVPFGLEPGTDVETTRLVLESSINWPVQIMIAKGVSDSTGTVVQPQDRSYQYPTELALTISEVKWEVVTDDFQQIGIQFSKAVKAEDLAAFLSITDADTSVWTGYKVTSQGSGYRHDVQIHLTNPNKVKLRIAVAPGLQGAERSVLQQAYSTLLTREPEPLYIVNSWWDYGGGYYEGEGYDGGQSGRGSMSWVFELNQPVEVQELKNHLELAPAAGNVRVEPRSGNAYAVAADWNSNTEYVVRITPGLKYATDVTLEHALTSTARVEEIPKHIGFAHEGKYYFPRRTGLALPLESRNLDEAQIFLHRLFPSNIVVALSDINEGNASHWFTTAWSEELGKSKVKIASIPDRIVTTPLDLDKLFPMDKKGVFCVRAETKDHRFATKIVLCTNIGLLSHWQDHELVLFTHNLYSLAPLPTAKVSVYSAKNQFLGEGNTDDRGIVHLKNFNKALGSPKVAVVEHDGDYTFLELESRDAETANFTAEMPPYDRKGYDAFIYADRELYRPGETVHLHWLVRTNYGDALPDVPLVLTVYKPNGRELLTQPTVLSTLGTAGLDVTTERAYPTGKYRVQLAVPDSEKFIGEYQFSLEDFVPNRIKATVEPAGQRWISGGEAELRVTAQHLFGPPAADRKCEARLLFRRGGWKPDKWKEFQFDNDSDYVPESFPCGELRTDENGVAVFAFTYEAPAEITFPMRALSIGRVFELGGRAVLGRAENFMFPSDVCLGISAAPAVDGKGMEVFAAAIKPDETPAELPKVKITIEKQVWNYYVRRYYSHYEPKWSESFEALETREVDLKDGKGSTVFNVSDYGYYRFRVHSDATSQYSTRTFHAYGGKFYSVETARPSLIKITLNKDQYDVGAEVEAKIESPFDGQGIVVLQGDDIEDMIPVKIENGVAIAKFTAGRNHFPNVWVEATVIHAIEENRKQVYPFSSFAAVNVRVRDVQRQLNVVFPTLPAEVRPATPTEVQVEVKGSDGNPAQAELTLAAVDEGIHSITDYKNPDPFGWLSRVRRPDLRRAYYYDKVAYDFEGAKIGGDAEFAARRGSVGENWIKPVALWTGVVQTDAAGRAAVTLNIPEFTGQLRLVAVACTPAALGAQGANFFVRRPYLMQTGMPRFLLPGDATRCRVVVFNTTDAPAKAKVSWSVSGALRQGAGSQELEVPAQGEATALADIVAGAGVGQGEIRWEALFTDAAGKELEHLTEVAQMPVRPPAAFQSHHEIVVLKPGETREFRNAKFMENELTEVRLTIGGSPLIRLEDALKYLVGYPYGCVEQTTSRLLPLYLLRKNAALLESSLSEDTKLDHYIRAGIYRLFSMQTTSGGLGFWPGEDSPYAYGSVYALHGLTLIKNGREFEMPVDGFAALQQYVRNLALNWTSNQNSDYYLRAYALYVLALDGDLAAINQISRFDTVTIPKAGRFLLAAALAQNTKDYDRIKLYLSNMPSAEYAVTEPDGTLISDVRNKAVELIAMQQTGGDPAQIAARANELVTFLEKRRYGTTQETAFVIAALTSYLENVAKNLEQAAATVTGPDKKDDIKGGAIYRTEHKGPGGVFTAANTGVTDLYIAVTTRGVPEHVEPAAVSHGVQIERAFFSNRGVAYTGTQFQQTESYVVGVKITCQNPVKNLIVADLLPAGFEVENPRLDASAAPGEAFKETATPSYLDLRDDRLIYAFNALEAKTHNFYYVVRAVTPGKYQYPPAQTECMYDPSINGASQLLTMEVK